MLNIDNKVTRSFLKLPLHLKLPQARKILAITGRTNFCPKNITRSFRGEDPQILFKTVTAAKFNAYSAQLALLVVGSFFPSSDARTLGRSNVCMERSDARTFGRSDVRTLARPDARTSGRPHVRTPIFPFFQFLRSSRRGGPSRPQPRNRQPPTRPPARGRRRGPRRDERKNCEKFYVNFVCRKSAALSVGNRG